MSSLFSGPYYSGQALWELLFVFAAIVAEDGQVKVLIGFEREYSTGLFWETTYTSSRRHYCELRFSRYHSFCSLAGVPCCESGISSPARGSIEVDSA